MKTIEGLKGAEAASKCVAEALLTTSAVRFNFQEGFALTSGIRSPIYVDVRKLHEDPGQWERVIQLLLEEIHDADVVAGVATGGIPHSAAAAYEASKPYAFVRKGAREHGTKQLVEGASVEGLSVTLIEDMVTTGGSVRDAAHALYEAGAREVRCVSVGEYGFAGTKSMFEEEELTFSSLTSVSEIARAAHASGYISTEEYHLFNAWLAEVDNQ